MMDQLSNTQQTTHTHTHTHTSFTLQFPLPAVQGEDLGVVDTLQGVGLGLLEVVAEDQADTRNNT